MHLIDQSSIEHNSACYNFQCLDTVRWGTGRAAGPQQNPHHLTSKDSLSEQPQEENRGRWPEHTDQRLGTFDSIVTDGRRGDLVQRDNGHSSLQLAFLQQLLADLLRFHDNIVQLQCKHRPYKFVTSITPVFGFRCQKAVEQ